MQKIQEVLLDFPMLNDLFQIIVHLNILANPLKEPLQKDVVLIGLKPVTKLLKN